MVVRAKIIFEGQRYVVVLQDRPVEEYIATGMVIQRGGEFFDAKGRKVIFVKRHFGVHPFPIATRNTEGPSFAPHSVIQLPPCNMPYLVGQQGAGSINWLMDVNNKAMIWTCAHVAQVANTLCANGQYAPVEWRKIYMPKLYSPLTLSILMALRDLLHIDKIEYSKYDFADGYAEAQVDASSVFARPPDLIYFAGNCLSRSETGCFGAALEIPVVDYPADFNPVGKQFDMTCTLWQFKTTGEVLDVGRLLVNYDGRYAYMDSTYLLGFSGDAGIPGCSGSPIWLE